MPSRLIAVLAGIYINNTNLLTAHHEGKPSFSRIGDCAAFRRA